MLRGFSVIVPFKGAHRKTRLGAFLGRDGAEKFAMMMLEDLLDLLTDSGLVGSTFVVSSDPNALGLAKSRGATPTREPGDRGVNAAVQAGIAGLSPGDPILVLPSDLPLLTKRGLNSLISTARKGFSVISPSSTFDGTNALSFRMGAAPALGYDDDSFWKHLSRAAGLGLRVAVLVRGGVTQDVDTKQDFVSLVRSRINNRSTGFARKVVSSWAS